MVQLQDRTVALVLALVFTSDTDNNVAVCMIGCNTQSTEDAKLEPRSARARLLRFNVRRIAVGDSCKAEHSHVGHTAGRRECSHSGRQACGGISQQLPTGPAWVVEPHSSSAHSSYWARGPTKKSDGPIVCCTDAIVSPVWPLATAHPSCASSPGGLALVLER